MNEQDGGEMSSKRYMIGDIGDGARVMIGEHQTWIEQHQVDSSEGQAVVQQFDALIRRLIEDADLSEDDRELSVEKAKTLAESFLDEKASEGAIRRSLRDAKSWFATTASWAWDELVDIVKSDAATNLLAKMGKTGIKAAMTALLG